MNNEIMSPLGFFRDTFSGYSHACRTIASALLVEILTSIQTGEGGSLDHYFKKVCTSNIESSLLLIKGALLEKNSCLRWLCYK